MTRQNYIDSQLLISCTLGDASALKQLYLSYSTALYHVAYQRLKQKNLAELTLEESFVEIWSSAEEFNPGKESPIKWMVKITRHNAMKKIKLLKEQQKEMKIRYHEDKDFASVALRAW